MIRRSAPTAPGLRHVSADHGKCDNLSFTREAALPDAPPMAASSVFPAVRCFDCYPSPTSLPGPPRIGQFFAPKARSYRQSLAVGRQFAFLPFQRGENPLSSAGRTTLKRGSIPCENLSFSLSFPPRSLLAWAMMASAPSLERLWAEELLRPPAVTCSLVRLPAALSEHFATISPTSAAKQTRPASAVRHLTKRPSGTIPGWPFFISLIV
jgi:hypothetical protein